MDKKGFTLVELLAVIVIIGILGIITVPNVLEYFNESKRQAMIVQENKLVESGDILVRDYCKNPVNSEYQLQCDELYKHLNNEADEEIIDNDDSTYTRYICVSTLKEKDYYSEKLQYSGEDCDGVVVYRIDEDTDIQKDSFSVVKCGSGYKTIFENENAEDFDEFLETNTRADKLVEVFKECFPENTGEGGDTPVVEEKYQLTINFTEHNQYGQEVAEKISKKILAGTEITEEVPSYYTGTGENKEYFTSFVHSSSDNVIIEKNGEEKLEKPTVINNKINFKMPANNVTINIAYAINQYNVTFIHKDAVLDTTTFAGETHENNTYKLFNGESIGIPYKDIDNFKIVSQNNGSQKTYTLNKHEDHTETILYQQEKFNLNYDTKGGSTCENRKTEYKAKLGELCTTTKKGYTFEGWYLNGTKVTSETTNNNYEDITLVAQWTANEYQITYHMGNGTSTAGHKVLGTKTCTYDETCTLDTFASLGTAFLYSSDPNYGWGFAGWTNYENTMEIKYENGLSFTYNKDYNLDLYAIGKRNLNINRGIAPTTHTPLEQQWNPYSTSTDYLTNITLPTSTSIGNGWTFRGYKGGSTENDITAVTFTSDKAGTTFKANYNVYPQIRSIYERTLTMSYNGNGATGGSTTSQTTTQYYSSGYSSNNKNYKEQISSPTITLKANGFTKTGYTFQGWAKGSTSGTKYAANTTYTFAPGVKETNTLTMYALWDGNTYYIEYDCNGGSPEPYTSTHKYDVAKELTANKCGKGGYLFSKWNTKADNSGTSYNDKQSVTNLVSTQTGEITLFAQYTRCGAGTYAAAGATSCTSCPTGYTSLAGSDSISDCYVKTTAGNYVATANKPQTTCAAGGYCPGGTTIYYGNTGGRTACPANYTTSPSGASAQNQCYLTTTAGNYVSTANKPQTPCTSGGYCPGSVKVNYGSTGGRTGCPANYTTSPSGASAQNQCYLTTTAGNYVSTANNAQTTCTSGGYCPGSVKVNYGSTGGRTACPTNYASSAASATAQGQCYLTTTAGKYVASANSAQTACTSGGYCPGSVKVNYGSTGGRTACPTNYASSAASSTAESNCYLSTTAGKYVASAKAAQTNCTVGYYCTGGTTVYYGNTGGRTACSTGQTSAEGSDAASDCYLASSLPTFTYTGTFQVVKDDNTAISTELTNTTFTGTDYSYTGTWKVRFLTSGTLKFTSLGSGSSGIDIFLVGGGGTGGTGGAYKAQSSRGGGGGGGGSTTNVTKFPATVGTSYTLTIASAAGSSNWKVGSTTYYNTNGGGSGCSPSYTNGSGYNSCAGSGGSAVTHSNYYGASNVESKKGASGGSGGSTSSGSSGQYEFYGSSGNRYGAGGGAGGGGSSTGTGAGYSSGASGGTTGGGKGGTGCDYENLGGWTYVDATKGSKGTANTGSGGGGGGGSCGSGGNNYGHNASGASGGTGIIIIRNTR